VQVGRSFKIKDRFIYCQKCGYPGRKPFDIVHHLAKCAKRYSCGVNYCQFNSINIKSFRRHLSEKHSEFYPQICSVMRLSPNSSFSTEQLPRTDARSQEFECYNQPEEEALVNPPQSENDIAAFEPYSSQDIPFHHDPSQSRSRCIFDLRQACPSRLRSNF